MVNEKNPDGEFAENGDGPQPDIADEQAEAVENTIDGEQTSLDKSGPSEGNFEGPTAEELAALVRAVDRFFTPLEVPRQKTEDFRDSKPEELESRVIAAVTSSVQGTRLDPFTNLKSEGFHIASPHIIGGWGANVEVRKYTSATTLETMLANSMESIQRDPSELARHYVVLCIDLTDDKVFEKVDRLRRENDASYRAAGLHVVWPEQAWTLIFGDQETHETDKAPSVHMISDEAIDHPDDDTLGFDAYAEAIFGLIDHPKTSTPLTLAINARWGMGKSSLASLVNRKLKEKIATWNSEEGRYDRAHQTYWFNAWQHDEADRLNAAFMADIVRACHARQNWIKKLLRPIPASLANPKHLRPGSIIIVLFCIVFTAWAVTMFLATSDSVSLPGGVKASPAEVGSWGLIAIGLFVSLGFLRHLLESFRAIGSFVAPDKNDANAISLRAVRDELKILINEVTPEGSKFVVFIDDLERCRENNAVGVLEVVNQLLSFDPVVCIVIADMPAVATCVELKYKELAETYDPATGTRTKSAKAEAAYGRLFLQKFIQLQFDLPPAEGNVLAHETDGRQLALSETAEEKPRRTLLRWMEDCYAPCFDTEAGADDGTPGRSERARVSVRVLSLIFNFPIFLMNWFQRFAVRLNNVRHFKATQMTRFATPMIAAFAMALWLMFLGTTVFWIYPGSNYIPGSAFIGKLVLGAIVLPIVFSMAAAFLEVKRNRRKIQQDAAVYRARLARSENDDESGTAQESRLSEAQQEAIRNDIARRRLTDSASHWYRDAMTEAQRHLSLAPRNLKRLSNRLRLVLFTLYGKGLLENDKGLTPQHVGKWIALQEGWPELSQIVFSDPGKMEAFEDDEKSRSDAIQQSCKIYVGDEKLNAFLQSTPELSAVIRPLTRYEALSA